MPEGSSRNRIGRLEWALLLAIVLVGESFWGDEINLAEVAILPSVRDTIREVQLPHSAGYPVFLHYWMKLGREDAFVRFPSVIFGLAAVVLLYLAVRRTGGAETALVAALFLATSEGQVRFSREVAAYSLQNAVLIAAFLVWLGALRTNRWRDWIGFAVLCSVSHYLHPLASTTLFGWYLLVPIAWFLGAPNKEGEFRMGPRSFSLLRWLASGLLFGLSIIPQTLKNLEGARKNIGVSTIAPDASEFVTEIGRLFGSGPARYLIGALIPVGVIVLFRRSWLLGLAVAGWGAGTIAVWWAFAWAKSAHFDYHYFISHLPAFLILAAFGLDSIARTVAHPLNRMDWRFGSIRAGLLVLLALVVAFPMAVGAYREREGRQWPEYRQACEFLKSRIRPEDRFYVKPEYWMENKARYYLPEVADREVGVEVFFDPEIQERIRSASGTLYVLTRRSMVKESGFESRIFKSASVSWKPTVGENALDFSKAYDWIVASSFQVSPDDLLFEARYLENAGQLEFALEVINRAVEMAPHRFWIVRKQAEILQGLKRHVKAAAAFEAAARVAPPEWAWWMTVSRAENLGEAGDHETAIALLNQVLEGPRRNDRQALVWEVLGRRLAAAGKLQEARQALERTLELWKGDRISSLVLLGEIALRQDDREAAIEFYRRAAAVDKPERAIAERRLKELGASD
jgi:predicted negative regulator of RcsB-dependent stress response